MYCFYTVRACKKIHKVLYPLYKSPPLSRSKIEGITNGEVVRSANESCFSDVIVQCEFFDHGGAKRKRWLLLLLSCYSTADMAS